MLIGVVSDTHGHVEYAHDAARMLQTFDVAAVLHCGDIGSPEIVRAFAAWPTYYVFGNVDDPDRLRPAIEAAGATCCEQFGALRLAETNVALLHGHDERRLAEACRGGEFRLVCHGHTHVAKETWFGETLLLNPGALYRASPHTLAIVELPTLRVERIAV